MNNNEIAEYIEMGRIALEAMSYEEANRYFIEAQEELALVVPSEISEKLYALLCALRSRLCYFIAEYDGSRLQNALSMLISAWDTLLDVTEKYGNVQNIASIVAGTSIVLGTSLEEVDSLKSTAVDIYNIACENLRFIRRFGKSTIELDLQFAECLCNAAIAGQEIPNRIMLEESRLVLLQAYSILRNNMDSILADRINLDLRIIEHALKIWPVSPDSERKTMALSTFGTRLSKIYKFNLDKIAVWQMLDHDPDELKSWFVYNNGFMIGGFPEGVFGDVDENFVVSAYKCPHCNMRLYKTVFPKGKEPELYIGINRQTSFKPARVFASPCGRFFATNMGNKIIEGPTYQAVFVTGNTNTPKIRQEEHYSHWWEFFNAIGNKDLKRNE